MSRYTQNAPSHLHIPDSVRHRDSVPSRAIEGRLSPSLQKYIRIQDETEQLEEDRGEEHDVGNRDMHDLQHHYPVSPTQHHPHHHNRKHLYPVTQLSPKRLHTFQLMQPVFQKHRAALLKLFESNASYDKALERQGVLGKMEERSFVQLMQEHSVIPELASRVEIVEIFRTGRKGTKSLDGEEVGNDAFHTHFTQRNHEKYCGFGDFLVMLSAIATKVSECEEPRSCVTSRRLIGSLFARCRCLLGVNGIKSSRGSRTRGDFFSFGWIKAARYSRVTART